jgi:1-aminocyclopropane-1-carboxylate deaminase
MLGYAHTPIQPIKHPLLKAMKLEVMVKREDLNHPYVSGNKWWKLKYNLEEARNQHKDTLLTFGGAFSNHIYATAAAANELGFKSIGVIRGEELSASNKTLSFARSMGMQLHFVSRERYRFKTESDFEEALHQKWGDFYLIPEGGTNTLAIQGVEEWGSQLLNEASFDYLCCACGTGGTLAGLISAMPEKEIIGFSSLKGDFLRTEVQKLVKNPSSHWTINSDYHFGGYARYNAELLNFIDSFERQTQLPLEQVYTGKMLYGVIDLAKKGYFPTGSRILILHTGGLQGKV